MFSDDSLVHLAGIFHNLYLRLEETEHDLYDGDSGWYVYIHHAAERPTLGVRTHGTSLYPGQGRDLRLDMKKVVFLMNSFCFYIIAVFIYTINLAMSGSTQYSFYLQRFHYFFK